GTVVAADGGVLASFTGQAVTNNMPAPPTVSSAATNTAGTLITISFNKAMANPTGKQGQFSYTVNGGAPQAFSTAALNTDTTKIDLTPTGTAIINGNTVTVSYTVGTVVAVDGGVLATFAGQAVTNNVPPPGAPTVTAAATNVTGSTITISFNKAMANPAGKQAQFSYTVNGVGSQTFGAAALNADTTKIDLTPSGQPIAPGDTVTVNYTLGTVVAADGGVLASFTGQAVTNNMPAPPTVSSAATNTAGTLITISFNKAMANPAGKQGQFSYTVDGGAPQTFSAAALNADTTKIDLTPSGTAIAYGNTVNVSYTVGTVVAADGGVLATFADQAVTNNMVPGLPVPVITSGGVTTGDAPLSVTFSSSSSSVVNPTAYSWVFGDGSTSTVANPPAHTFNHPGAYLVTLSITNASGTGTSALYPIVATQSVPAPVANTTISGSSFSINLTGNVGNYTSDATNIYLTNVTGFSEIIVTTTGVNTSGGNLSGTITSVEYILPNTTALVNGATINFQPTIFEYGWSTSPFLIALTIPNAGENSTYQSQLSGSTGYNPLAVINISTGDLTSGGTLNMSVPIWWYTNYGGSYSTASTNYLAVIWNHGGTISTIYPTWGPTSADGLSKWFTISVPGFSTGGIVGATSAAASGGGGGYNHQNTNNYGGVGVGGGVGYVGPAPAAALATSLNTATFTQDSQGQVTQDYQINTGNEGSFFVPSGTKVLAKDGSVLNSVSVTTMQSSEVPAGAGYTFAGYAVSCSPDGATFTPAITLKFTLTASEWNTLLAQAQGNTGYLGIKVYNPTTSSWTRVPTMVDANAMTVSALVSHFSTYGLFVDTTLASPSATTVQTSAPAAPVTTPGSGAAIPWTMVIGVIVIIIVVAGAGYYFFGMKKQGL
ncbi:S-layer family protein, partial [Methanoregula sp.]|uniref:beta strand repeat-containing protein n=1 Tax=Methanoregula sp. TaxID=2052170 RepID=UPI0025F15B75